MMKANRQSGFWQRCTETLSKKDFTAFSAAQNAPLKKTIRVNTLRNSVEEFLKWQNFAHPDWKLKPHPFSSDLFEIERQNTTLPLGKTLGHLQGRFYVQEASSLLPPQALGVFPGQRVLDAAAAPGSKTTQLAALMQGRGLLVANEYSGSRSKVLVYNLQKCGVPNAVVTHYSADLFGRRLPGFFDRILLDAPCTGEGTFRKDRSALENWSEKRILAAAGLQRQLIRSAFDALQAGGVLVYSTCTLAPEENEAVVQELLDEHPGEAEPVDLGGLFSGAENAPGLTAFRDRKFAAGKRMLRIWPHLFDTEGFFIAAVKKKQTSELPAGFDRQRDTAKMALRPSNKREAKMVYDFLSRSFDFSIADGFEVFIKEKDIWLLPEDGVKLLAQLRADRPGILLGRVYPDGVRLAHEFCLAFGADFRGERVLDVDEASARQYLAAENLPTRTKLPKGDIILRFQGIPLGLVKNTGQFLKNNLPRHFVVAASH